MKPFTHALALGLYLWVPTKGSSKRLFYCPYTIVLRTLARLHPEGAEEKGTRYVERLGGSSRIIRGAGRICKPRG